MQAKPSNKQDLAAIGFLKLLIMIRKVIIQDSIQIRDLFPDLRIWQHEIFSMEEYKKFSLSCINAQKQQEEPMELILKNAIPHLYEYLKNQNAANQQAQNGKLSV